VSLVPLAANALLTLATQPEALAFRKALGNVAATQEARLLDVVRRNARTEFGRRHGFEGIRSVADYQRRVPTAPFEAFAPYVARLAAGEANLLTEEPVVLFEPTSGSTAATKLVPYTRSLQRELRRALFPWLADLYTSEPALLGGPAYWSVSPVAVEGRRTPGGIPIGFEDDTAYLGGVAGGLARAALAVPPDARRAPDVRAFRLLTLAALVSRPDLRLVSVWNPTFLELLVAPLRNDAEAVLERLAAPRRRVVERALLDTAEDGDLHATLWPRLRVVSCWADAAAARDAARLAALFPQARLQPKGLLSTEGVVSIPLVGHDGAALAVRSHFFELRRGEEIALAHELRRGTVYEVILTTGGGLYRYETNDLVEVVGTVEACPLLRFVGRKDAVSDRFGEKLHEAHVSAALEAALRAHAVAPAFAMVAFDAGAYTLFVEAEGPLLAVGEELDRRLRESFQYDYARRLGQLGPLRVFRIDSGGVEAYLTAQAERGMKLGDVKAIALSRETGWPARFRGATLDG